MLQKYRALAMPAVRILTVIHEFSRKPRPKRASLDTAAAKRLI
jgi:hypothetical protein